MAFMSGLQNMFGLGASLFNSPQRTPFLQLEQMDAIVHLDNIILNFLSGQTHLRNTVGPVGRGD